MAGALLIPVNVSAKVLNAEVKVPDLGKDPFNRDATLQSGVHLHWALPDALTRARMLSDKEQEAVFPGVPDRWLVVRLNPLPPQLGIKFKRAWAAWVVDSRLQTATPVSQWNTQTVAATADVHTAAGMLPNATGVKYPGWGHWTAQKPFDLATAAYYPACRTRFGFFDNLQGLNRQGKVTYMVAGWYSNRAHDPLYNSDDRDELLARWKLAKSSKMSSLYELAANVATSPSPAQAWMASGMRMTPVEGPNPAEIERILDASVRGMSQQRRSQRLQQTSRSIPQATATNTGAASHVREMVEHVYTLSGPNEIICHGTVVEVPLAGTALPGNIPREKVRLFPSITRARAAIAAAQANNQSIEFVEMMLDDLEYQKSSMSGVLDMPGAAHAKTFQSIAGKAKRYARLEVHPVARFTRKPRFSLMMEDAGGLQVSSGNWPMMSVRSASIKTESNERFQKVPNQFVKDLTATVPQGPTDAQVNTWVAELQQAFATAVSQSAAQGKPIDPRLLRVQDHRKNAQPSGTGKSVDRTGSDSAGWFLDIQDTKTVAEFYRGAYGSKVYLPNANDLYELPGPNWYRPWSPQIVISGSDRSYRFGEDGRFRADGFMDCRISGETLSSMKIAKSPRVYARDTVAPLTPITSKTGIPGEVKNLVEETMLLDSDAGAVLASHVAGKPDAASATQYRSAIRGLWVARLEDLSQADMDAIEGIDTNGKAPSPVAVSEWHDPMDPVFVDVNYAHPHSSLQTNWELKQDHVEMSPKNPTAQAWSPAGQVKVFNERSRVTASIMKILDSSFVTKFMIDKWGNPVPVQSPPNGIDGQTFTKLDILSAPLSHFDESVINSGLRERTGALRLNRLEVIDVFGVQRKWDSGIQEQSVETSAEGFWNSMEPRLPYWSRLQHRLLSAANPQQEATQFSHPVCGFLLPDFIEHSLEVFDGEGKAIGQLKSDKPQLGAPAAKTLDVKWEVHPWLLHQGDPFAAIVNPILRSLVAGIEAQSHVIAAGTPGWHETGLTAFLRVVDTVRGTLDPSVKTPDRKIRLLGEPIVVFNTRLMFEATAVSNPSGLKNDPAPLAAAPALPVVKVRIGEVSRPDDGVLGCFLPNNTPSASRFAPVSKQAASEAIINGLVNAAGVGADEPVNHVFIKDLDTITELQVGQSKDVIVLMDTRGGMYTTTGVLPRKKITIPREHMEASLRNIEATFRIGPILALPAGGNELKPAITPIAIEGYASELVRVDPDGKFVERPVPEGPPVSELPLERVKLTSGWLRVSQVLKD